MHNPNQHFPKFQQETVHNPDQFFTGMFHGAFSEISTGKCTYNPNQFLLISMALPTFFLQACSTKSRFLVDFLSLVFDDALKILHKYHNVSSRFFKE